MKYKENNLTFLLELETELNRTERILIGGPDLYLQYSREPQEHAQE